MGAGGDGRHVFVGTLPAALRPETAMRLTQRELRGDALTPPGLKAKVDTWYYSSMLQYIRLFHQLSVALKDDTNKL